LETNTLLPSVTVAKRTPPPPRVHRCPWGCGAVIGSSVQVVNACGAETYAIVGRAVATDLFTGWCANCRRRIRWLGNKRVMVIVENGAPLEDDKID
jgi:hypothetical protein